VPTYTHSLQPILLNDNVNQFRVGLETDNGHFTLKVKTIPLFCSQLYLMVQNPVNEIKEIQYDKK
jgi:hypothetical protein